MRTRAWVWLVLLGLSLAPACASKAPPPVVAGAPKYPSFIHPLMPSMPAADAASSAVERAWLLMQAGDLQGSSRELAIAQRLRPNFRPAGTVNAYVLLARGNAPGAAEA